MFIVEGMQVLVELCYGAGTDDDGGDTLVAQEPGKSHLGECLPALHCNLIEGTQLVDQCGGEHIGAKEMTYGHARVVGDALQVAVGKQALRQGREGYEAGAVGMSLGDDT